MIRRLCLISWHHPQRGMWRAEIDREKKQMSVPVSSKSLRAPETDSSPDKELIIEHYKHLCEQTRHYNDKLTEAFNFHVTTVSAIIGGCIWLATNGEATNKIKLSYLSWTSNALVLLLTSITLIRVFGNLNAWYNIRESQHEVFKKVPAPHWIWSTWLEALLAVAVIAFCAAFISYNPFTVLCSD